MAVAAIELNFDQALDVHGDVFAQIAFHVAFGFNHLADAVDLVLVEVLDLLDGLDLRRCPEALRSASCRCRRYK